METSSSDKHKQTNCGCLIQNRFSPLQLPLTRFQIWSDVNDYWRKLGSTKWSIWQLVEIPSNDISPTAFWERNELVLLLGTIAQRTSSNRLNNNRRRRPPRKLKVVIARFRHSSSWNRHKWNWPIWRFRNHSQFFWYVQYFNKIYYVHCTIFIVQFVLRKLFPFIMDVTGSKWSRKYYQLLYCCHLLRDAFERRYMVPASGVPIRRFIDID